MRLLAIGLIAFLFSCKVCEKKKTEEVKMKTEVLEKASTIEFSEVKSGENSDYKTAQNIIFTTQQEMDLAWGKMFAAYDRKPPIPMVDFETKQLLLITMGEQPSGGYTTKVKTMTSTAKGIVVTIEDAKPGKTCNTTSALIYPFQLVEMPKTEEAISFVRVSKINECK